MSDALDVEGSSERPERSPSLGDVKMVGSDGILADLLPLSVSRLKSVSFGTSAVERFVVTRQLSCS